MDGFSHEHLVQLVSVAARYNIQIDIPAFILLGIESSGKTCMLEAITKSKIGYSAVGMATKCPVKYVLRRCNDPEFRVDNQLVQEAQIANRVESHMKRLETVVRDELVVEITGPDVPDLVIIDLPGLNFQKQEIIDDITAILDLYCRNENSFLIGVVECAPTMGQCVSFNKLREVLNNVDADLEGRVIVLLNKVDKMFKDWLALPRGTLEEQLGHDWEADFPTFFMSLNPERIDGNLLDEMKFLKKKQFLRSLPKIERQTVTETLKGQVSSEFLESRFFLDNILTRLEQRFAAHLDNCKPQLLAQLRREQQNTHAKVQSMPDFRNQTPEDVVRYFQMAPQTFVEKAFSILNGRTVVPSAAGTISSARAGPQEAFNALAGSFFDDYAKAAVVAEQYPIIWSEERLREVHQADLEQFPRSILAQLSDPSTGKASFNRAKQILDYMLLQLPMEQFNNAMIDNWARNSDRMGHYDILGAVRQMVSEQVARAGQAIKWWTTIVRSRVQEYAAAVVSDMVASHVANVNGEIRAFYEKVASTFCAWVEKDILVPMEERWDESVNLFSNYFPVDISVRTLLFVAVSPVEDLIYREDCTRYPSQPVPRNGQPAKEAQAEREDLHPAILKAVQDAIIILRDSMDTEGDTEDEAFEKCLQPLKPYLPNDERHLLQIKGLILNNQVNDLTTYFLKSMPRPESKAEPVAPEASDLTAGRAMIRRIEKIRQVIRESGKEVRFQDAVQGGYQTVHEQPDTMIVHDYLRSAAYEYYVMIIDRFLFDFDASYSNFCFNKLEMSRMNAPIAFMNNMLAQEPVRDGLVAARQAEINSLKEEYEHLQEQKEEIDRVCASLLSD